MDLKTYLLNLGVPERDGFAVRCGSTRGHLQNVMYGIRPCAPELAVAIERESHKTVTRKELRPLDWKAIWPELDDKDSKPARSAAKHPAQRASDRSPRHPKAAA